VNTTNAEAASADLRGRVVNERFRLEFWLGGTGTSGVYVTERDAEPGEDTQRKTAIKLIPANAPGAEDRLARWSRTAKLSHPHLMAVIECGRCEIDSKDFVYQVTDCADEVLAQVLVERSLTADEARAMLTPILDALAYLKSQGFAHGRLRPSNILVVDDQLKLSADCIGFVAGFPMNGLELDEYAAPEVRRGQVTTAADVWSLGMTLVATLTQVPAPFSVGEDPVIPAAVPEPFARIARECLRADPAKRCTLEEIRSILEPNAAPADAEKVPAAIAWSPPAKRAGNRMPVLIATVAVVVLAAAALIARHAGFRTTKGPQEAPQVTQSTDTSTPNPNPGPAAGNAAQKPSPAGRTGQAGAAQPAGTSRTSPVRSASSGLESTTRGNGREGVIKRVIPDVLPKALESIRGRVDVGIRVTVSPAGDVTNATLENPSRSQYFNRLALDAARQWRFAAGPGDATPLGAWQVHFEFRQDGIDAGAKRE
jgi:TonB family protein